MFVKLQLEGSLIFLAVGPVSCALCTEGYAWAKRARRLHRNVGKPLDNADGRLLHDVTTALSALR